MSLPLHFLLSVCGKQSLLCLTAALAVEMEEQKASGKSRAAVLSFSGFISQLGVITGPVFLEICRMICRNVAP